jgi:hypothetical protein
MAAARSEGGRVEVDGGSTLRGRRVDGGGATMTKSGAQTACGRG